MIIVTGATGQLGKLIVQHRMHRLSPEQIGVSVRDPARARALAEQGIRVRRGDFDDASTLAHAFEGGDQILLISSNVAAYGGDALAQHATAIAAARSAGASRIVYTSQVAASPVSLFPPALDHAQTEEMLRQSGLAWTSLRNGFYASTIPMLIGEGLKTGVIQGPADGKVSWTSHNDLAEAAAVVLVNGGMFDGPTPPLTGPQAVDLAELAAVVSEMTGRPIRREVITDEAMRTKLAAFGVPEPVVAISMGLYAAARRGEFAAVDPTLQQLLGRTPQSVRGFLAAIFSA